MLERSITPTVLSAVVAAGALRADARLHVWMAAFLTAALLQEPGDRASETAAAAAVVAAAPPSPREPHPDPSHLAGVTWADVFASATVLVRVEATAVTVQSVAPGTSPPPSLTVWLPTVRVASADVSDVDRAHGLWAGPPALRLPWARRPESFLGADAEPSRTLLHAALLWRGITSGHTRSLTAAPAWLRPVDTRTGPSSHVRPTFSVEPDMPDASAVVEAPLIQPCSATVTCDVHAGADYAYRGV